MVVIFIVALIFVLVSIQNFRENFTRLECPTRNMSYDLRGEAYYPPRTYYPFMGSEIGSLEPSKCVF